MRTTLTALVLATALPLVGALSPAAMAQQAVVVRSGETLSEIADRHGVSLSRLMQANGISNADLVQVGQRLTIPGGGSTVSRPAVSAGGTYTVKDGETLSEIADRQGISLSRLMQANGISNADLVQVGQRLTIPGSAAVATRPSQPTAPYTVKSGETLSDIAARFDTSTERLIQINAIRDPDLVMSGTRLQVPLVPGRRPSAGNTAAASAKASATPPAVNRQASEHTVQSGESLSLIAERYGTSVDKLAALNQLEDPALLQVGTRLKLRGTSPAPRPASSAAPMAAKPSPAKQPTAAATPADASTRTNNPSAASVAKASIAPASVTKPVQATTTPLPSRLSQATTAIPSATTTAATTIPSTATTSTTSVATTTAATAAATTLTARSAPATAATAAATAQAQTKATSTTIAATASTAAKPFSASTSPSTGAAIAAATAPATAKRAATPAVASSSSSGSLASASARPANGDWRSYGPLQVDWSNLQPMGGSFVAPSVNGDGQALYVAVNCTARKLNVTSQAGQWKAWESPGQDFEQRLVQDICLAKAS